MNANCPNLSNKQVKKEFDELVDVFGEDTAYFLWNKNEGYSLDKAPNGADSSLFQSLLNNYEGDRVKALVEAAKQLIANTTEEQNDQQNFRFGDWENNKPISGNSKESENFEIIDLSVNYDDGGETSIVTVKYKKDIKKDIPLKDRESKVLQEYNYLKKLRDDEIAKIQSLTEDSVELNKDGNLDIKDTATTIYIKRLYPLQIT